MDRQVRRLGFGIVVFFSLLFGQLAYVQVVAADRIANDPANAARQIIAEYQVQRGTILSASGLVLAKSVQTKAGSTYRYRREYPSGDLYGAITGYYSRIYGRSGLEQSMNAYLSGSAPELATSNLTDLILGNPKKGGTVVTTIDPRMQQVARDALGDLPGAVVAMDPKTGDVLALYANPSFDPNVISSGTDEEIKAAWEGLLKDPDRPLVSRAKDELFLPGSSFKIVTAAAALQNGLGEDRTWPNPHRLTLPLTNNVLENFDDEWCASGASSLTMRTAFKISCNVTFAQIGLKLGAEKLAQQARAFGFCPTLPPTQTGCLEDTIPFALPFQTGRFPQAQYFERNDPLLAYSAIGLDNDLTNPMMQAIIASAVANGGLEMVPRLVTEIRDPQGRVIRTFDPEPYGQPLSSEAAASLRDMMVAVVNESGGTGYAARIDGILVAGKTGTATQGAGNSPHAWFTSFAPAGQGDTPRIAVAVIVVNGGGDLEATGGRVAAPIARQVIQAYLQG